MHRRRLRFARILSNPRVRLPGRAGLGSSPNLDVAADVDGALDLITFAAGPGLPNLLCDQPPA